MNTPTNQNNMTKLSTLQQTQVNLLQSIFALCQVRAEYIPVQSQQSEVERLINGIEENLNDALKVIHEMQKPAYASLTIEELLKSAI